MSILRSFGLWQRNSGVRYRLWQAPGGLMGKGSLMQVRTWKWLTHTLKRVQRRELLCSFEAYSSVWTGGGMTVRGQTPLNNSKGRERRIRG